MTTTPPAPGAPADPAVPAGPVSAALTAAADQLDLLTGLDLATLPSAELLAAVDAAEALHRRLQAVTARILTATETDGMWATTGARSFPAWYRARTGRHHTTAHKNVREARRLRDHLPATADALAAGTISADHATALTTHTAATPAVRARLNDPDLGEDFLLGHAATLGATEFTHLVKHWAYRADPAAADRTYRDDSDKEHLTLAPTTGGYHLTGWLTTANGQAVQEVKRSGLCAASFLARKDAGMPKQYDAAAKERAVRMVREQVPEYGSITKACEAVAARLGMSRETLRGWVRQGDVDAGARDGMTTQEREEIKALKARVRRLEEDNAILRSAATFFAGELDPRNR
ncbi:uncharacterized protein DUF222 [Georgenia soli]|uniref:Uncharacterized protein DUF222 n=2 Tax=Georgenia soli TaxID=638953 RepID=A0A2A9EM33_9MICO|nr:uncharacterized protein DUF222 [Georgenia soli]